MKAYTVVWPVAIQNQLAEMWLSSAHRQHLRADSDLIDYSLARFPERFGDEIGPTTRYADFGCLRVMYQINEMDRLVRIGAIKLLSQ